MIKPILYIVRGVSGAGKSDFTSNLVKSLGNEKAVFTQADDFLTGVFDWRQLAGAHEACRNVVRESMKLGIEHIFVSNTTTTQKDYDVLAALAEGTDYRVVSLIVENRHGNKSIHDVPEKSIEKQKRKFVIQL